MAAYTLTFSLHLLSFWNGAYNDFQNQGLIFKNPKFENWHKNLSSPIFKTVLSPKLWVCHFCPKHLHMTGKCIQFAAAKAVLVSRQTNLMIFQSYYFPSKPEKHK